MKRFLIVLLLVIPLFVSCSKKESEKLILYSWADYVGEEVIKDFKKETGIDVVYAEFDTNENMYAKVKANTSEYDIIIPSDYMIEKMIREDMVEKINFENIPNIKSINATLMEMSKSYDSTGEYSIPYSFGTLGIIYNKKELGKEVNSFSEIFNKDYKGQILMIDSVRDAFACALKYNGVSLNSTNELEIEKALNLLKEQKSLVQAYANDQIRDKMISNEAEIGVYFSPDAFYMKNENKDLEYVLPKEGTNLWIDGMVILKGSKNKENAEKFINYLFRDDVAYKNYREVLIASTNENAAKKLIEDGYGDEIMYPDNEIIKNLEVYKYLGRDIDEIYKKFWFDLRGE